MNILKPAVVAAAALAFTALVPFATASAADKIIIGCTATTDCASAAVAEKEGIFKKNGLDAHMLLIGLNSNIPAALLSNSIQIGGPTPSVFLQAVDGGVLMRAGHTEAGCDLAAMAGCTPAAVICEIMKDDGTMARLPDLQLFAAEHGLKIGTIADLIQYRSRNETLLSKVGERPLQTAHGEFIAHAFRDLPSQSVHLALVKGQWDADTPVPVRVHEPLSVLDALETGRTLHSWSLDTSLEYIARQGHGVAVLLNCGESGDQLLAQFDGSARAAQAPERGRMDLRTYGVGAQILRECGVQRMQLMGQPRRLPSMAGYGLEISGYIPKE